MEGSNSLGTPAGVCVVKCCGLETNMAPRLQLYRYSVLYLGSLTIFYSE